MKNKTKDRLIKIVSSFVFFSFIIPIVFLIIKLITFNYDSEISRSYSDYVLMLVQCVLGVIVMILPSIITKKLRLEIPSTMYLIYWVFLYCAIFLGEIRNFYYHVPHFDTILHTFSGAMLGALGFSFISLLNKEPRINLILSPAFVALFAFCFGVTFGALWEIYEFSVDGIMGVNMQKFASSDGTDLIGRMALEDTMKDIIVDTVGAFASSLFGYAALKYKKGWLDNLLIKRDTVQAEKNN
ncbi:MAG: hypothetical protein IJF13_01860 [Clostridia bacterium]|nr:hypothetical protein [Clostridia bacterium]